MKKDTKQRLVRRCFALLGFVLLLALQIAIGKHYGGFINTRLDDMLLIPLIYCLVSVIYVSNNWYMPAIIFCVGTAEQMLFYLRSFGLSLVDTHNLTYTVISSSSYIKTFICYAAGTILIYFAQIAFYIARGLIKGSFNSKERHAVVALALAISLFVGAAGYCQWENTALTTTYYTYSSSKVTAELNGYRIVQVSDLHNQTFGRDTSKLVEEVREADPDIIVITGDIVDCRHTDVSVALEFVAGAVEIAPVYYVTGNHEKSLSKAVYNSLISGLEELGVIMMNNKRVTITVGESSFKLIGLDDGSLTDSTLSRLISSADSLNILLAHEPQYIENYAAAGADVVLCGHAHGGQIRIPLIGGLYAPGQGLLPEYYEGQHEVSGTTMIISRGLGNSLMPVRINNRPEVVVLELKAA